MLASVIIGVATATTETAYTQSDILNLFKITDPKIRSLFLKSAIGKRYLTLPPANNAGTLDNENQTQLLQKHQIIATRIGSQALITCLNNANASLKDVKFLCCVTTTGFLSPGLSAHIIDETGLNSNISRLDVAGMGCNAGLNALNVVSSWAQTHPNELAVLLCVEICSAAYVYDNSMRTAVVNSLFGDGAAALAVKSHQDKTQLSASIVKFTSLLIPNTLPAMRYDWNEEHHKFSFFIDRDIPYIIGANAEKIVDELLNNTPYSRKDITHWIVHSGGKKVIDAIRINLALSRHDLRHTTSVLNDYGNLSSGSFLFSYERLLAEGNINVGDIGIMMTMGPGSTIEAALVKWI